MVAEQRDGALLWGEGRQTQAYIQFSNGRVSEPIKQGGGRGRLVFAKRLCGCVEKGEKCYNLHMHTASFHSCSKSYTHTHTPQMRRTRWTLTLEHTEIAVEKSKHQTVLVAPYGNAALGRDSAILHPVISPTMSSHILRDYQTHLYYMYVAPLRTISGSTNLR